MEEKMGIFSKQLLNVCEWPDKMDGIMLWKWQSSEIKKGSKLIIRPGQDAVFLYNGKIEGIFTDSGEYDIESDIIPFLTTLKSFKFGFNSPMKAEVVFINNTEQTVKWGTKNPVAVPVAGLPGGMPIRSFGTFACQITDPYVFLEKISGVSSVYTVEEVRDRMISMLDQLLMAHIAKEGHDMFNLQADARAIAAGILADLDMDFRKIGIKAADFRIESFSYPEEVQKMQEKAAAQSMIGDVGKYTTIAAADGMSSGAGGNIAGAAIQMQMGMQMANEMMGNRPAQQYAAPQGAPQQYAAPQAPQGGAAPSGGAVPNFCPNCGQPTNGMKFCGNCGSKLA